MNQIVSIDLKEYGEGDQKYILYAIDVFSRLTVGIFIANKKPETIGQKLLEKWISVFGVMDALHSDLGGEFINNDLVKLAEYLGVKQTSTAAYSPNMNGCNERNHAVVDRMMEKMIFQDPSLNPEIALCWALNAKNSLENYQGFSPSQIVFGQNPRLPALYSSGPPGFEEVSMSKAMADHINALHSAREAFIECEADRVLKAALKQRVFASTDQIKASDWIYFKNKSKRWEGPVKVTTVSGKLLYAVRGGKLLTINSDHAKLVSSRDNEIVPKAAVWDNNALVEDEVSRTTRFIGEEPVSSDSQQDETESDEYGAPTEMSVVGNAGDDSTAFDDNTSNEEEAVGERDSAGIVLERSIGLKHLKPKIVIRFRKEGSDEWSQGKIHSRAGKATPSSNKSKGRRNKYGNWWTIQDLESGHIEPLDA